MPILQDEMTIMPGDYVWDESTEKKGRVISVDYGHQTYRVQINDAEIPRPFESYKEIPQFCKKHKTELMYDEDGKWRCIFCEYV